METALIYLLGALQEAARWLPTPMAALLLVLGGWIWRLLQENARLSISEARLIAQLTQSTVVITVAADKVRSWEAMLRPVP
jgi:hypothetical protein